MTNLPSFSNLTPGFPQEAVDSLHSIEVNTSSSMSLRVRGYDHSTQSLLYEDQYGNIFAVTTEGLFLYSINKKGYSIENLFLYQYSIFSSSPISVSGILKNSFKNTGKHGLIIIKNLGELNFIQSDSFLDFQGDIFFINTLEVNTITDVLNDLVLAFRNAVGGNIYVQDNVYYKLMMVLPHKNRNYYIPGTPMLVKPLYDFYRDIEISIGTVALREYYYTEKDSNNYNGLLGDDDGYYIIQCDKVQDRGYIGELKFPITMTSMTILFTKNSVFRIPRKDVTIDKIGLNLPSSRSAPIYIPYIPSMITSIRGYNGYSLGTMDIRDVSFSSKDDVNTFFGLHYNDNDTLDEISSFYACDGTLQITSSQKDILETISGLIVPLADNEDPFLIGYLFRNSDLYIYVTPEESESTSGGDSHE